MVETSFTPSSVLSDSLKDGNLNITCRNKKKCHSSIDIAARHLLQIVNLLHAHPPRRSFLRESFPGCDWNGPSPSVTTAVYSADMDIPN